MPNAAGEYQPSGATPVILHQIPPTTTIQPPTPPQLRNEISGYQLSFSLLSQAESINYFMNASTTMLLGIAFYIKSGISEAFLVTPSSVMYMVLSGAAIIT